MANKDTGITINEYVETLDGIAIDLETISKLENCTEQICNRLTSLASLLQRRKEFITKRVLETATFKV